MPKKTIRLNPRQSRFARSPARYVGFVGGVGSGKTFTMLARGLEWQMQPVPKGAYHGPRGACLAIHHRELDDVVLPEFFEMVEGTGILVKYIKSQRKAIVRNPRYPEGPFGEILFRSLNNPNWMRGLQLSWFAIDEARNVPASAWNILVGRLRQPGYNHGGWLATTPNGFDWVYDRFHEDGDIRRNLKNPGIYELVMSRTEDNREFLPEGYIEDLYANYSDENGELTAFGRQEIWGSFEGVTEGSVFYAYDQAKHYQDFEYNPELSLYSTWDFGVGDPGVLEFAQVEYVKREVGDHDIWLPKVYFLDALEHKDLGAKQWSTHYHDWLEMNVGGRRPDGNFGDPAGRQRNANTGTSVITDLAEAGVNVRPAPKLPPDHGIRLANNMMQGGRIVVRRGTGERLSKAFTSARWKLDDNGNKVGTAPVHDWTSHYVTAAYYLLNSLFTLRPPRTRKPQQAPPPGSAGDIKNQILRGGNRNRFGHKSRRKIRWNGQSRPVGR